MPQMSRIVMSCSWVMTLCVLMGCTTFHSPFAKKFPMATAENPVTEIICLWQPGEGVDPEEKPCKGFTGQILFLAGRDATQVEGEVRVYLFDDQGTVEEQTIPLRQYDFSNGAWRLHLCESHFGPSYNIFVPYVRRGVTSAECSLRVRYIPKYNPKGRVFSEFATMPLNGSKKIIRGEDAKPITVDEADSVASAAYQEKLRRTTTISMDSRGKATVMNPPAKAEANAGQVQLASHEVSTPAPVATAGVTPTSQVTPAVAVTAPSTTESPEAEKIRRLEAMLQQLLEQKSSPAAPAVVPAAAIQPAPMKSTTATKQLSPGVEPRTFEEESRHPLADESDSAGRSFQLKARRSEESPGPTRTVTRRAAHPLDDDVDDDGKASFSRARRDIEPVPGRSFGDSLDAEEDSQDE